MNESNKIRVGVIGAGKMSQKTHLPIISRLQNDGVYTLVVICDLNVDAARQAAEKFGFENYIHEADSVFNYDIDALYVFATAQLHYEYSYKALQRGVHVFIEKPPAPSVEDFQKLIDASNRTGCVGVVGLNRRFQKNIELIKEELSGTGLYAMEAVFHKPVAEEQPPHGAKTWLPINAIHSLDLLVYLKGAMPYRIHTATNAVNTDVPQNFSVLLEWKDGTHAVLSSDYSAGGRVERYAFHGYNTSFEVDLSDKPTYTKSKGGRVQRVAEEHTVAFRGFDGEHEAFARAINTGEAARHAFKDCIAAVYLTDLIERGFSGDIPTLQVESNQPLVNNESMKINNKASLLILNADNVKQHLPTLKKEFKVVFYDDLSQCDSEQKKAITALITGPGGVPITAEMIDDLPNLEIAGIVAASLKSYNTEVLLDKGVQIFNASDAYADSVAEFVLMQAIAGVREATRSHDIMRAGGWGLAHTPRRSLMAQTKKLLNKSGFAPIKKILKPIWRKATKAGVVKSVKISRPVLKRDFRGSTVGIIGFGEITRKLIPLLQVFGCTINICSEYLTEDDENRYKINRCSLDVALNGDVVILLRGLSDRTKNSFGKSEFSAMKDGAVFINAARAGIVREQEMIDSLQEGKIFACLDVFHKEPLAKHSVLRALPNVFLTSHIAACSLQMRKECASTVVRKVTDYLNGREVEDIVIDKSLLKNMT